MDARYAEVKNELNEALKRFARAEPRTGCVVAYMGFSFISCLISAPVGLILVVLFALISIWLENRAAKLAKKTMSQIEKKNSTFPRSLLLLLLCDDKERKNTEVIRRFAIAAWGNSVKQDVIRQTCDHDFKSRSAMNTGYFTADGQPPGPAYFHSMRCRKCGLEL